MCIYGEYSICSLCPQEECLEKEEKMDKEFLRKWTELLGEWTHISYTYDEVKKITDYLRQHKESIIKEINEL